MGPNLKKETRLPGELQCLGHPDYPDHLLSAEQMIVIKTEVAKLCDKGAFRRMSAEEARRVPGYYSRMFCISKPCGAWGPIINLKPMNRFVVKKNFRLETIRDVKKAMRVGQWAATIDLRDAYYHISKFYV